MLGNIKLKGAHQDCGVFYKDHYDDINDCVIIDYSHLVVNDYDLSGSIKARELFAKNFPQYIES